MKPLILAAREVRALLAGEATIRRARRGRAPLGDCPLGGPGARLWIQERYQLLRPEHGRVTVADRVPEVDCGYWRPVYAADCEWSPAWRAPVTLPRWASRCTAEIRAVEPVTDESPGWRVTLVGACPRCRWAGCSRMSRESMPRRGLVEPADLESEARERACRMRAGGRS